MGALKKQNDDAIAEFLAKGGKITKLPTKTSAPPSLYVLQQRAEKNAEDGYGYGLKRKAEINIDALPAHLRHLLPTKEEK